jgi:hypothetical protein
MVQQRIPSTAQRIFAWQLGLRGFLILCMVLGASTGLLFRWILRQPNYTIRARTVDGFMVSSMWVRHGNSEALVYLLAYPDGNKYGGGSTTQRGSRAGRGVAQYPEGIFVNGRNATQQRQDCKYWVYTNSTGYGSVRPLDVQHLLTPDGLMAIEHTALWKDHLRPALIVESQRFDQWFLEKHGSRNGISRFTPIDGSGQQEATAQSP